MIVSAFRRCSNVIQSSPLLSGPEIQTGRTLSMLDRILTPDSESHSPERDFEDRRQILFRSGKGGDPAPNTVRGQKKNGPAFGGHGGAVILRANAKVESLVELPLDSVLSAAAGGDGHEYSRGVHARDTIVDVPLGTIVRERVKTDRKTDEGRTIYAPRFLYQFLKDKDTLKICDGGRGGVAPLTFKKGDGRGGAAGQRMSVDLELRLVNDCSLVGVPNSGKTSIISSLTSAWTRIGPEPYSTTRPHLGTLQFRDGLAATLVDLPGVTEGASQDKSRGIRVLRHTWRSKLILYCIDVAGEDDAFDQLQMLREEVRAFDPTVARKEMIVATKCDMVHRDSLVKLDSLFFRVQARCPMPVVGVSARFGLGIPHLVMEIRKSLFPDSLALPPPRQPAEYFNIPALDRNS